MDIERDSGLVKNRLTAWAGWLGVASCAVMAVKCLPFVTALCRRELQGVTCNDSQVFIIDTGPIVPRLCEYGGCPAERGRCVRCGVRPTVKRD